MTDYRIVTKSIAGKAMRVVDPATYPYGQNHFDDEEPIWVDWLAAIVPGEIAIDVGASWGVYTLAALANEARVLAFEPADSYEILRENVRLNGGFSGGSQGERPCACIRGALFSSSDYPEKLKAEVFSVHYRASQPLAVTTLDELLPRLSWAYGRICAIKIDVEGAELGVLEGTMATLKSHRPVVLVEDHDGVAPDRACEVSDYPASIDSRRKILSLFSDLGYDVEIKLWDVSRHYLIARPRPAA